MTEATLPASSTETPPDKMRLVITASAAGTVFEWYDFFVYAQLTTIFAGLFFKGLPDTQATLFTLLTFSVGLIVRPIGALVFGKIGDSAGRKGAFLFTISIMGLATFAIGCLPTVDQAGAILPGAGILAPILLIALRVLQGFALGGEYGGAAIYVAEHAARNNRGAATALIQTSAAIGLFGALGVIIATRTLMGEAKFGEWGWRIPFWISLLLLAISVWIRLKLSESPAFQKLKEEGAHSKAAFKDTFLDWNTVKIMTLCLFGLMMGQGVSWYATHFYAPVFLEKNLGLPQVNVNQLLITIVMISAPFYVFFAWISDKIGRKPVMLFGMILFTLATIPGYHLLTKAVNPALDAAQTRAPVVVVADPGDCTFQLDLTGGAKQFATSCDIAKGTLTNAGVIYTTEAAPAGAIAHVKIGGATPADVEGVSAVGQSNADVKKTRAGFEAKLRAALAAAGYPAALNDKGKPVGADLTHYDFWLALGVMFVLVIAATALYGPQAAALVELFPTRIRYTALSFPYNVGTGWFGGLLAPTVFAISTATGNMYAGLWFPVIVTGISAIVCLFFWPETKDRDIHA